MQIFRFRVSAGLYRVLDACGHFGKKVVARGCFDRRGSSRRTVATCVTDRLQ